MGKTKEFVLALGGGGGRGLAHLGVLEALEEHDLRPVAIVGTSIGSMFGAMYALNCRIENVINRVKKVLNSEAFAHLELPLLAEADTNDHTWLGRLTAAARESVLYARAARGPFLTDSTVLQEIVEHLCEGKGFADLRIALHVTCVRFPSGTSSFPIGPRTSLPMTKKASFAGIGLVE